MPTYVFHHPDDEGETIELFLPMSAEHRYVDDEGREWVRVWYVPNAGIDTKWDARSERDFLNKTASKKGTVGDILDKAKELSEVREQKEGRDLLKRKYYDDYSKKRNGKRSLAEIREQSAKTVKI